MQSCKQGMWRGRLAYKSSSKFSRARSTSGRFKCSYVFCGKSERESESSTFALGPTTGTGNEKRRALRKSSERGTICQEKVYERGTFFVKNCIWRNKGVGPRGGASPYKNFSSTPPPPLSPGWTTYKRPWLIDYIQFFITKKARHFSHFFLKIWHLLASSLKRLRWYWWCRHPSLDYPFRQLCLWSSTWKMIRRVGKIKYAHSARSFIPSNISQIVYNY